MNDYLNVLYTNADSLLNKKDELQSNLALGKKDIIAITEVIPKTHKELNEPEYQLPEYEMFVNKNPKRGVALYISKELNPQEVNTLNEHNF